MQSTDPLYVALLDRVQNYKNYQDTPPPWVGKMWRDWPLTAKLPAEEPAPVQAALVKYIRNLPRIADIEATIAFCPEAEPLLRRWVETWERSFPGWETDARWSKRKNEEHYVTWAERTLKERLDKAELDEDSMSSVIGLYSEAEYALKYARDDLRDKRLHVIDDADVVDSCRYLSPGMGVLAFSGKVNFTYQGVDEDGYPRFTEETVSQKRIDNRVNDNPAYWTWDFFLPYLNRRSLPVSTFRQASAMVADMAWQGHTHAFIKGAGSKTGTWTVNLSGVKTIEDGEAAMRAALDPDAVKAKQGYIIQEHLPFTHEQRYFIFDGRVIASVCSDRHFSVVNKRDGKRLDDRIATLVVPSVDRGEYDRGVTYHVVDRALSSKFARKAREIAKVCRENGVYDFVVDIGITSRGITAVEVNTLHLSGPYCLDRKWFMSAFERRRKRKSKEIEAQLTEHAKTMIDDYRVIKAMQKQFDAANESHQAGLLAKMLKDVDKAQNHSSTNSDLVRSYAERMVVRAILDKDSVFAEETV